MTPGRRIIVVEQLVVDLQRMTVCGEDRERGRELVTTTMTGIVE